MIPIHPGLLGLLKSPIGDWRTCFKRLIILWCNDQSPTISLHSRLKVEPSESELHGDFSLIPCYLLRTVFRGITPQIEGSFLLIKWLFSF